jgi:endonuclease/exonuclease/phosphatase family metal-dependent hydrolase
VKLITWNIQWSRGCDGVVDPDRIMRVVRNMGDFDVLCLQEVARNFPGLPGSRGEDQFRIFDALLPRYTAIEGIATDTRAEEGTRQQFGNMILTRLPVLQSFRHLLPWPADPEVPSMQRCAVEVVLATQAGPLRVTTTHLEYYSLRQRTAQVDALLGMQREAASHGADPDSKEKEGSPFQKQPRPASGILTADFNFKSDDPLYRKLQSDQGGGPAYRDAWTVAHPGQTHTPTLGLFDRGESPDDPYACDFIFVTDDLAPRVRDVTVNTETDASDHQPVMLTLEG